MLSKVVPLAIGAAAFGRLLRRRSTAAKAAAAAVPPKAPVVRPWVCAKTKMLLLLFFLISSARSTGVAVLSSPLPPSPPLAERLTPTNPNKPPPFSNLTTAGRPTVTHTKSNSVSCQVRTEGQIR
jgi:hypothetical protein